MKKIFLSILMIFPLLISACSCDKFDMGTYESAVKNHKNSTGFEYQLTVIIQKENQEYYVKEESSNAYMLSATGEVENFASKLKSYRINTPKEGTQGAPILVYTLNRYYVGEVNTFFTKESATNSVENKVAEQISYENKYNDVDSPYNIRSVVPTFSNNQLSNFSITSIDEKKGYSLATFKSVTPAFAQSSEELTTYKVTMDNDFYFNTIEFSVIDGDTTTTYKYEFLNYNGGVNIIFPADLDTY